jgi:hypothetical protein
VTQGKRDPLDHGDSVGLVLLRQPKHDKARMVLGWVCSNVGEIQV